MKLQATSSLHGCQDFSFELYDLQELTLENILAFLAESPQNIVCWTLCRGSNTLFGMNPSMFVSATTLWSHSNALHSYGREIWKRSYLQICHAKACLAAQTAQVLYKRMLIMLQHEVFSGSGKVTWSSMGIYRNPIIKLGWGGDGKLSWTRSRGRLLPGWGNRWRRCELSWVDFAVWRTGFSGCRIINFYETVRFYTVLPFIAILARFCHCSCSARAQGHHRMKHRIGVPLIQPWSSDSSVWFWSGSSQHVCPMPFLQQNAETSEFIPSLGSGIRWECGSMVACPWCDVVCFGFTASGEDKI